MQADAYEMTVCRLCATEVQRAVWSNLALVESNEDKLQVVIYAIGHLAGTAGGIMSAVLGEPVKPDTPALLRALADRIQEARNEEAPDAG